MCFEPSLSVSAFAPNVQDAAATNTATPAIASDFVFIKTPARVLANKVSRGVNGVLKLSYYSGPELTRVWLTADRSKIVSCAIPSKTVLPNSCADLIAERWVPALGTCHGHAECPAPIGSKHGETGVQRVLIPGASGRTVVFHSRVLV